MGLVAAFDAAGDEASQLIIVVAGFISSAADWDEFSKRWSARLRDDDLSYMHMAEFAHSTGQFKEGWKGKETRRKKLLFDLMELIRSHVYHKFGIVVANDTFRNNLSRQTMEEWHLNAYSLAGRSCVKQINEWLAGEKWKTSVDLVFEKGDSGAGKLHARLVEDGCRAPVFKAKKAYAPLQAGDFLAYEVFLEVTRMMQGSEIPQRWGLTEFERIQGDIGTYKIEDLQEFQRMVDLTKTLDDWAVSAGLLLRDGQGRLCRINERLACKLELFVWASLGSESGTSMASPVCPTHRDNDACISVSQSEAEVVVSCQPKGGAQHILGRCAVEAFRDEQRLATEKIEAHQELRRANS